MVESKTKTATARAKIAHKLARYYRATPIDLVGTRGGDKPSTSHLCTLLFTQPSEVLPREDSETKTTLGTLLMTRRKISGEPASNPNLPKAENLLSLDQLLFCFPE